MKREADKNKLAARSNSNPGQRPSRSARNLSARKFDPVLRVKRFEFCPDAAWKQVFHFNTQHTGENQQFEVGNAPLRIFQTRHRFTAGIPSHQLQFDRKLVLRPSLLLAQFSHLRADHIQLRRLFFDTGTLATGHGAACRLYLTFCGWNCLDRPKENVKIT